MKPPPRSSQFLLCHQNAVGVGINPVAWIDRDAGDVDTQVALAGAHPQKSAKKGAGERNLRVHIAGVAVNPGDWIYADADGILVAQQKLA